MSWLLGADALPRKSPFSPDKCRAFFKVKIMSESMEMPRYQCHKKVWALKIELVDHKPNPDHTGKSGASSYGAIIHPENKKYAPFDVSPEYVSKHRPQDGGYYVQYEGGYESYSPAEAFESGYSPI